MPSYILKTSIHDASATSDIYNVTVSPTDLYCTFWNNLQGYLENNDKAQNNENTVKLNWKGAV